MSYIDWKKLKGRVSLRDILAHYGLLGDLDETSRGYQGECPFCGSKAFKANTEKNAWFCFGACKTKAEEIDGHNGGNILDFVARMEGVSVKRAGELIAEWFLEYPAPTIIGKTRSVSSSPSRATQGEEPRQQVVKEAEGRTEVSNPRDPATPTRKEAGSTATPEGGQGGHVTARQAIETRVAPDKEVPRGRSNPPLPFTLKSLDLEHPTLVRLGFARETLVHFGAGYFTGKGLMHDKVALPFHDKDGVLVAYVGYAPEEGTFTYPPAFDRRLDLYNVSRCEFGHAFAHAGIVLVTDLLDVLRLHELGVRQVLSLPSEEIHEPQLDLIETLAGPGAMVDFAPATTPFDTILSRLAERFHVRCHRRDDQGADARLARLVETLD